MGSYNQGFQQPLMVNSNAYFRKCIAGGTSFGSGYSQWQNSCNSSQYRQPQQIIYMNNNRGYRSQNSRNFDTYNYCEPRMYCPPQRNNRFGNGFGRLISQLMSFLSGFFRTDNCNTSTNCNTEVCCDNKPVQRCVSVERCPSEERVEKHICGLRETKPSEEGKVEAAEVPAKKIKSKKAKSKKRRKPKTKKKSGFNGHFSSSYKAINPPAGIPEKFRLKLNNPEDGDNGDNKIKSFIILDGDILKDLSKESEKSEDSKESEKSEEEINWIKSMAESGQSI